MKHQLFFLFFALAVFSSITHAQDISKDTLHIDNGIFIKVDEEASFPGNEDGWRKFLEQNLNPNTPVDNGAPAGRYTVIVEFIVDLDGTLSNIKTLTKMGYGMEQEVLRIIKKSGKWSPAMLQGKPVKAYRKQPVTFQIDDATFYLQTKVPYTLFANIDNEMIISVPKVKPDDLYVTISHGKITATGNGNFIVKVSKEQKAVIRIYNAKKGNKQMGAVSFDVLPASASATGIK